MVIKLQNTLTNKNAETIAQVMQTANRLIKFNKSLLFLSKIENKIAVRKKTTK